MNCPLCDSGSSKVIRTKLRYDNERDVLKCADCDFVYLRRLPEGSQAFYAGETYRKKYGPDLTKSVDCQEVFDTYFPFQQPIIDKIAPLLKPDMTMLDVGCSTGHFLAALKGKVGTRVGVELSHDEVEFCRTKLDFPVYDQPIETVEIAEGPFDLVTSLQVLEHVDNPVSFLKGLGKHMKDDGKLYIELPNLDDALLSLYDIPAYGDFYFREPHISYFSEKTLQDLVTKAGFTGTIGTVQRYSVFNHLQWKMNGSPQSNFKIGNRTTLLDRKGDPITDEFNAFFARMNADYQALVEKHGLGESLTFLGTKIH